MIPQVVSRRSFLRLAALGMGGWLLRSIRRAQNPVEFPTHNTLGRVCVGKVDLKEKPDQDSKTLGALYEDAVIVWQREVVGRKPYYINQRWIETPDGFIYSPYIQPVQNLPQTPVNQLRQTKLGEGMWAQVMIPYVDIVLDNKPSSHSWIKAKVDENQPIRLYYEQVFWVDRIRTDEQGKVFYHINPNYYGGVDMFWIPAESMRPITPEEIAPIHPDTTDKRIVVDVIQQCLSCYEGKTEVYYCRVSTGAKFDMYGNPVDKWSTPIGKLKIFLKYLSLQMSGGTTGAGYDLPGIGWTSIFAPGGVAIHSTFWHNDYGVPRSHGCVNVTPEDAKWIFRWSLPVVSYDTGLVDVGSTHAESTPVEVIES